MRLRTGYSFRVATGKLEEVADRLVELGETYAPITDRSSTFGWVKWEKVCKKRSLTPVFGVELAVTDNISDSRPIVDWWTFIAQESVAEINRLVDLATQSCVRGVPMLTYEQAQNTSAFRLAGHHCRLEKVDWSSGAQGLALGPATSLGQARRAASMDAQFFGVGDNKYTRRADRGFWQVLCGRGAESQSYPQHILSREEWHESVSSIRPVFADAAALAACWEASRSVLSNSAPKLPKASLVVPSKPQTLRAMCEDGARRVQCPIGEEPYRSRLGRELSLIADKSFEDYFYIVADICRFARERMLVGPARGSSCGSLVCYLLGITTVDPIPYGLIFERFIDVNRDDLPDIDIDFSDTQRQHVFEYAYHKYGRERVARLGTVALFRPASALSEISGALGIPKWVVDRVADSIVKRSSGDSRALDSLGDALRESDAGKELLTRYPAAVVAARFEGHPRHYSQHAAGIVIADRPITDYVAVDHRTGATMCDKKDAEDLNLLKIDALGLTQLSVFEDCLELIGQPRELLDQIPMDDQEAFDVINKRQFSGIFQFNGNALQSLARQFHVDNLNDIIAVTALARPGPMASGGATRWVRRRLGEEPVEYPHAVFEPYLRDSLGIVIYQEQVMEICRNIGGLGWGEVTALRKAMSKSLGKEYFNQFGDPWKKGAIEKGVDPAAADKIWDDLCAYGAWSFNKSHSVAYGIISYQCCWLKAHHPFEFAAATLTHENDPDRQIQLLREMVAEGYDYVPVDPEHSLPEKWTAATKAGRKVLVGPLANVKGIGPSLSQEIFSAREQGRPLGNRAKKLLTEPRTPLDTIFPVRDRIRQIMPDPTARNIRSEPIPISRITPPMANEKTQEVVVTFGVAQKIAPRDQNEVINVAKRGYEVKGPRWSLNLFLKDDTDNILCNINRFRFEELARPVIDRGRPGKAIYAVRGRVVGDASFRMIAVDMIKYIGDMEKDEH